MLFGFEFAIGFMLAFVIVPMAVVLIVAGFKTASRTLKRSAVAKSAIALMLGALWVAWIFTH